MKYLIISICILFSAILSGQDVVIDQKVIPEKEKKVKGPNTNQYFHFNYGLMLYVDKANNDYNIKYGIPYELFFGFRFKQKLNAVFSLPIDLWYSYNQVNIKDPINILQISEPSIYEKQYLQYSQIKMAGGLRINFDPKRGNYMGKYIDLTAYIAYNFSSSHVQKDKDANSIARNTIVRENRLKFINNFSYGLITRLMWNKFGITAQYRFSDIISDKSNVFYELSKFSVGIEFDLF